MTQIAIFKKADIATKTEIETVIQELGYDFTILSSFKNFEEIDELSCSINGQQTSFEIYHEPLGEISEDHEWITPDLTNQDTAISFVWGASFAAGACIGLISIALIDKSQALVYYLDDEMRYSREMLIADTVQFLNEFKSRVKVATQQPIEKESPISNTAEHKSLWDKLRSLFN